MTDTRATDRSNQYGIEGSKSLRTWFQSGYYVIGGLNSDQLASISEDVVMAHILKTFRRYNQYKTEFLYEQLTPKKKLVFDLVPLLIHLDGQGLLKDDDICRQSPHGIYSYEISPRIREAFETVFPNRRIPPFRYRASYSPSMPIKSISLIGSLGSIAQNSKSDFDYWICIDSEATGWTAMHPLIEKLDRIERWAQTYAGAEVHCFPLEIKKIRARDFGHLHGDHSGTAQGKLLIEELYRSLTLVAGQVPLWWALPPGVDDAEYRRLAEVINSSHRIDSNQLVDLGNVYDISLGEFYGAAVWHINKTICSPFKSVLKLAILEEYLVNQGQNGLLCEELKRRLLGNEEDIKFLDPYLLMFERAVAYLTSQDRLNHADLLQRSIYLKSGVKLTGGDIHRQHELRKKEVVRKLVKKWGWDQEIIDHLNNHRFWSFGETLKFSRQINKFIVQTYQKVVSEKNRPERKVKPTINPRDLTILGRKLFVFYSRRTNKVESISNVADRPPVLFGLTLQQQDPFLGGNNWAAYRGFLSWEKVVDVASSTYLLKRSNSLTEILIWLINNELYDHWTSLHLNKHPRAVPARCTVPDLHALLRLMLHFFPLKKPSRLNEEALLQKPHTKRLLLVINLEEPDNAKRIVQTDVCSQNSWGEIFIKHYDQTDQAMEVARNFLKKHFAYNPAGAAANFKLFVPPRQFNRGFIKDIRNSLGLEPKESLWTT